MKEKLSVMRCEYRSGVVWCGVVRVWCCLISSHSHGVPPGVSILLFPLSVYTNAPALYAFPHCRERLMGLVGIALAFYSEALLSCGALALW